MSRISLTRDDRRRLDISADLIGVVVGGNFVHLDCFATEAELVTAIEDEDRNVVVVKDDDWADSVGLCATCGGIPTEEPE